MTTKTESNDIKGINYQKSPNLHKIYNRIYFMEEFLWQK